MGEEPFDIFYNGDWLGPFPNQTALTEWLEDDPHRREVYLAGLHRLANEDDPAPYIPCLSPVCPPTAEVEVEYVYQVIASPYGMGEVEVVPRTDVYRVQGSWGYPNIGLVGERPRGFVPNHWWSRTWQAEWDGCKRAVRAYTKAGVERKAEKAIRSWMNDY